MQCTICIIIILLYYFSSPETQVKVIFNYTAQQHDELSIKVGEILKCCQGKWRKDGGRFVMIVDICVCTYVCTQYIWAS